MTILETLEKYDIELTKQGDLFVAFCPFHRDENRPNFTVYVKTDSWFCYTCSDGGDPIKFISQIEGISRQEATNRMYSDLSFLLKKIAKEPDVVPYNEVVSLQVGKQFRSFLYEKPSSLPQVKEIMSSVDAQLARDLDIQSAMNLVSDVSARLNSLKMRVE